MTESQSVHTHIQSTNAMGGALLGHWSTPVENYSLHSSKYTSIQMPLKRHLSFSFPTAIWVERHRDLYSVPSPFTTHDHAPYRRFIRGWFIVVQLSGHHYTLCTQIVSFLISLMTWAQHTIKVRRSGHKL